MYIISFLFLTLDVKMRTTSTRSTATSSSPLQHYFLSASRTPLLCLSLNPPLIQTLNKTPRDKILNPREEIINDRKEYDSSFLINWKNNYLKNLPAADVNAVMFNTAFFEQWGPEGLKVRIIIQQHSRWSSWYVLI